MPIRQRLMPIRMTWRQKHAHHCLDEEAVTGRMPPFQETSTLEAVKVYPIIWEEREAWRVRPT